MNRNSVLFTLMQSTAIDRLLQGIRRVQSISLAAEILITITAAIVCWSLALSIADRYLWYHPVVTLVVIGGLSAFFISRSLVLFYARSDRSNARAADRLCNLQDRLTTYVEFRHSGHPFLRALARESQKHLIGIRPWQVARTAESMFLPLLCLAVLSVSLAILPLLPVPAGIKAKKQDRKAIMASADEVQSRIAELLERQVKNPDLQNLLKQIEQNANELRSPETNRTEALKLLNTWKEHLEQQGRRLQESDRQKLQQAWDRAFPDGVPTEMGRLPEDYESILRKYENSFQEKLSSGRQSSGKESGTGAGKPVDPEKLNQAFQEYRSKKAEREKAMAELQQSLEEARGNIGNSGKERKVATDSRIKERDLEKSRGGVEDGPGTTNKDIGPQHFSTEKKQTAESVEDRTKATYEQLYAGQRIDAGKDLLFLESQWDTDSTPGMMSIRSFGLDSDVDSVAVDRVLTGQTGRESGIRKEKVPARYHKIVQEYFQRIQPD